MAIASSLATIQLLEEELIENASKVGDYMLERMRDWPHALPACRPCSGTGPDAWLRIGKDQPSKERFPELRDRLELMAFERGIFILGCGPNSIRFALPWSSPRTRRISASIH